MGATKETAMELLRGGADMTRNTYILVFDGEGSSTKGASVVATGSSGSRDGPPGAQSRWRMAVLALSS